ncbi:CAMK family protein kinase [Histomonas meleagridis]|uniref:CAMK family protein kinase n=1 Tax=Histomonas meleagridis TaxID=135588 RepID=UPI0035598159|nr:CAMK family protein kinase [Histomonas meleagridis]KAH0799533.1 CAMK family protein kinase [Histomonas meleagridis]
MTIPKAHQNLTNTWPSKVNSYEIGEELGHGAFSHVCKATNTKNNQQYAIKIFAKPNLTDKGDQERFQREVNTMAYLRHDNLVALYDFFWDENNFYLVMDYCQGGELFDYIVDHDKLSEPVAALIFQQIVSAIAYCHSAGVAHRDLKPENILITKFPQIKVSDFGLCGFISEHQMMETFCGSPCYCSPECLCRIQYDGPKSDIWSLGVILYAMVTGEHPWNISNTSTMLRQILKGSYTVPPYVSAQCKDLITSMMKVNPQDRITIDAILNHPWLKVADKCPKRKKSQVKILLPPINTISMQEISEATARTSTRSEHGIVSPFLDTDDKDSESGGNNALPRLRIRSSSVGSLKVCSSTESLSKKNTQRKLAPRPRISSRQKSAANLLPKVKKRKERNSLTPMTTIFESS